MMKILIVMMAAFAALLGGCAGQEKSEPVSGILLTSVGTKGVLEQAEEVLGEMHFSVDKSDAEAGYLRSKPLRGGQFFEFWRKDNVGARSAAEANLHSLRRTVELRTREVGGQVYVRCDAKVERLSLPEREVDTSTRAYGMFTESQAGVQNLELSDTQKRRMEWVELEDDKMLASAILRKIEERITGTGRP